jgi:hypothetical protein
VTEGRIWCGADGILYYYEKKRRPVCTSAGRRCWPDEPPLRKLRHLRASESSRGIFLRIRYSSVKYTNINRSGGSTVLCCVLGENINLWEQEILTVSLFDCVPTSLTNVINSFHLAHPDARIVTKDWSELNTRESSEGGYDKLLMGMIMGNGSPDTFFVSLAAPPSPEHASTGLIWRQMNKTQVCNATHAE